MGSKIKISRLKALIILLSPFVLMYFYGKFYIKPKFDKNGRYTIGIVTKFYFMRGGGGTVFYSYKVKNKNYKGSSGVSDEYYNKKKDLHQRFITYFVSVDEGLSEILVKYPIPDSIKFAPQDGWTQIPKWSKKTKNPEYNPLF